MYIIVFAFLLIALYMLYKRYVPSPLEEGLSTTEINNLDSSLSPKRCNVYHLSNYVYYPRYKFWWRWVKDMKTRPEYNRIFPPFWNTHYDPNITSDEYYQRLAADHILASGKDANQIRRAQERNFQLRQDLKFN